MRPRYNRIDETDKTERTEVGTFRVVPGWRSAPMAGLRFTLEAIFTGHAGSRLNDDGALINSSPYPLLPDPRFSGANQILIEGGIDDLRARAGRQVVRMDNQRWVSDNNFRQIPQLFDGAVLSYTGIENTELSASHFIRQRTTSGTEAKLRLTLLHAAWNPAPDHSLAAYGYFHDQAQNGAFTGFADSSYRVLGARGEGSAARFGEIEIPYVLEYAQQRPYANGDSRVRANYWRAGAGLGTAAWTLRYDYEVKGSNAGLYGLQMPLTDFYSFNGWTLHFFNTPRAGLHDQWITGRYTLGNFTLVAESHRFKADFGGTGFGRENDLRLSYAAFENCVIQLQHSRYDPGSGTPDPSIRKTWLTLTYTY